MSLLPSSPLIDQVLRTVARRYRLPAFADTPDQTQNASPSTALAIAIEQARRAVARDEVPAAPVKRLFVEALARLIHDAMRTQSGDPVFQAMVLRHRAAQVREYASLSARADQDRRLIHATVNAIAHPAKQQRLLPGPQREALAQLHACASSASWSELHDAARRLLRMPEIANESSVERGLTRLLDSPELERLHRLDALASDDLVRQYRSLWDRHGLRSGSSDAAAQGVASQQRGAAVEASAAQALEALAQRLNAVQSDRASYRVVTSMRVPPSLPASPERAKTEWDVVLLRRANADDGTIVWDVCLLVEVKASVDAATTDLSRLLRGLRLLAHAEENAVYSFETRQGTVRLRGASLRALTTDEAALTKAVLYCCDAPAETTPRLLGAASRMQLLSAQASLEFASATAEGRHADSQDLEPVWHQLLESPRWRAVLHQYPMLRQVRDLMVHTEDLLAAIDGTADNS
ncbi:3-deoxy-D-arabino-heptulosonate 7-phosphate synthase [Paraburkholderia sp. CNPSo 3157]|uniref:3-deoxy-D-arabino-heptulosonate 7-phosphate synthase n=1 Tax=Paraburkholderia franconis TaxID=2654983 RepID=A0A7X1NCU9_9BURK|nr:3-deoxy-D-arabino-heptulosonate 7-phosphate synthase [Paraburkholderia franconis]MPW19597.1 3-deoxy-D-arabino-heptulosonate 7-phosphate synthase [Paraburkholderia franconis]